MVADAEGDLGNASRPSVVDPFVLCCLYLLALPWDSFLQKFIIKSLTDEAVPLLYFHTYTPLACSSSLLSCTSLRLSVRTADVGLTPLVSVVTCPHPVAVPVMTKHDAHI